MDEDKAFRADFTKNIGIKLNRCHNPFVECSKPAIRAHSIQNAKVLDLLHAKGKVYMVTHRLEAEGLSIKFRLKGRNEASTFTGLCAEHDEMIFSPIDKHDIEINNVEQLFLCAYRSVLRELHVLMVGAVQAQDLFSSAVKRGIETDKCDGPIGTRAISSFMHSYQFYLFKFNQFDRRYITKDHEALDYDSFYIEHRRPVVAVSTVYSLSPFGSKQYAPIVFNIFPINESRSLVSFCYAKEHSSIARASLDRVFSSSGEYRKYEISRLIIAHSENFVLSPSVFADWSPEKVAIIEKAFLDTAGPETEIGDSPEFMLF